MYYLKTNKTTDAHVTQIKSTLKSIKNLLKM